MLAIKQTQIDAMMAMRLSEARGELAEHLARYFPSLAEQDAGKVANQFVERALSFGKQAGIHSSRGLCHIMTLAIDFGVGFASDPQYPWISACFEAESNSEAAVQKVYDLAAIFLPRMLGDGDVFMSAALRRIGQAGVSRIVESGATSGAALLDALAWLYPEKLSLIGHTAVENLVRFAYHRARESRLPDGQGAAALAVMMFMLGSGFQEDPRYPWSATPVANSGSQGESDLIRLLASAQHALSTFLGGD